MERKMKRKEYQVCGAARVMACSIVAVACVFLSSCNMDKLDEIKELIDLTKITALSVSPSSMEIAKGEKRRIALTVEPQDANEPIDWVSYGNDVAKVNESGLVTGVDFGHCGISVSTNGHDLDKRIDVVVAADVSTLAGNGTAGYSGGIGSAARFYNPQALATDGSCLYVADAGNHAIRRIEITSGTVSNFAGTGSWGSANGAASSSSFYNPCGIACDGTNLYVADTNNNMIRKIVIASGLVSTLAGSLASGTQDGIGTSARFNGPIDVIYDIGEADLYVADSGNNTIRRIGVNTGVVSTVAGSTSSGFADGSGTAARFDTLTRLVTDFIAIYAIDQNGSAIRKIDIKTFEVTTFSSGPVMRAMAMNGNRFYFCGYTDISIKMDYPNSWAFVKIAGDYSASGLIDGFGSSARFKLPNGILYLNGKLYVADSENNAIRVVE
jgi:hypothetical protein